MRVSVAGTLLLIAASLVFAPSALGQPIGPSTATPKDPEPAWYLEVAGGQCDLFVQEYGTGADTVVVLHGGWGAEHSYLLDAFAGLGDRFHLVFYDQRGSLRSPCPDSLVSVDAHIRDLERIRQELGEDRVHLAGHSMGTYLALSYLEEHPDRTGGLVLMGSVSPKGFGFLEDSTARNRMSRRRKAFFERSACDEELREERLNRPDSVLSARERSFRWRIRFTCGNAYHVERWRAMEGGMAFFDQGASSAAGKSMGNLDAASELREHPCGVQVLIGDHDWIVGGPYAARYYRRIEGVEVELLESAGHQLWLDAPKRFERWVREALQDVASC